MTREESINSLIPEVRDMYQRHDEQLSSLIDDARIRLGEGWIPAIWDTARELAIRRGMVIG
jgi:hypothetical protein